MKVYILRPKLEHFQGVLPTDDSFWEYKATLFSGQNSLLPTWDILQLEVDEDDKKLPKSDFIDISVAYIAVFSEKAVNILNSTLLGHGELLAAECDNENYFLFNVTQFSNILNEALSDINRLDGSGRILKINKYIFNEISDLPMIFKLHPMGYGEIYVSEEFKNIVESSGLLGFEFILCT